MRCNLDGSEHEILIQNGDFNNPKDAEDQPTWCIRINVNEKEGKFYWKQKGVSKGRIFQASIEMQKGENVSNRSDIEMFFSELPEPVDLEFDEDTLRLSWSDQQIAEILHLVSLNSVKVAHLKCLKKATRTRSMIS